MPQDVAMFDPSGTVRQIPADQVADAQKSGAQIAHSMIDPSGKARYIPHDQYDKALAAGALPKGAVGRKSDHEIGTLSTQKGTAPAKTATDKVANFIGKESPTIGGALGGVAGGVMGGLPGAVAGAMAGGAAGESLKEKTLGTGPVSAGKVAKEGAEQGAWELGGGLAGKGIMKAASLLGVDEAVMKFALKSGEDFDRDLNPAAAMNKWKLKAMLTKDLYQKVQAQTASLSKTADAILDSSMPTSTTLRPYAIVKGVIDKYVGKAAKTLNPDTRVELEAMINALRKEFPGSAAGTDRIMTTKEANALKRQWGESIDWSGKAPDDKLQATYKTMTEARRDIYQALNKSIADNMGGNEGKVWMAKDHDIFNLMEAKSLIQKSAESHSAQGRHLWEAASDTMRRPGPASMAAGVARNVPQNLAQPGIIPNIGRATMFGEDAATNNPIPMQQGK
jgi:hypothetical protein